MRALEREPERRYPTVRSFADDLRRFLRKEAVEASPPSAVYRLRKFVERRRREVIAGSLMVGLLGVAVWQVLAMGSQKVRAEAEAQSRAARLLGVRDSDLLEQLELEAQELWPLLPEEVPRFEAWLARAAELEAQGFETAQSVLDELGGALESDDPTTRAVNRWLYEDLVTYRSELEAFFDPVGGTVADVRRRLAFASTVEERTVTGKEPQQLWDEARAAIANPDGTPYGGLEIAPQVGLLPLGPDPVSGLWEFGHLQSGRLAERDELGRLAIEPETGIVLVLIPGGTFPMGAIAPDDEHPLGSPNVDPEASSGWGPVVEIALDPYFLSKYEMTQAQWARIAGSNPSHFRGDLKPVESVDWETARVILHRLHLDFPTEAQWERGARAGTTTPWWGSDDSPNWCEVENVCELHEGTVEIRSYAPNPFGLYDILGNVSEFCRDWASDTHEPEEFSDRGDGRRLSGDPPRSDQRTRRGGQFGLNEGYRHIAVRAAHPWFVDPTERNHYTGVRPMRALVR